LNIPDILTEPEEMLSHTGTPYLSHSRLNKYLLCPEQYRLYYVENLRLRRPPANLLFGQVVHRAMAYLFNARGDPVKDFINSWGEIRNMDVTYSARESWERLQECGQGLIHKFVEEELHHFGEIESVELDFRLTITSLELPLVGIIDLVAEVDGKPTVVDFKTSASVYQPYEVMLSDQLTAYQFAVPGAEQAALCVLVKTKEPKIEWQFSRRGGEHLTEYLFKAEYLAQQILSSCFYKRPGKWCVYCDYLPVCTGDKVKARETLIQIQ
jgi:hypothetical protein